MPIALNELGLSALLLDPGKMRVPLDVLNKLGERTEAEYKLIKRHPLYLRDILAESKKLPANVIDIALSHYERINCSGYPYSFSSDQISQVVRMVTIVGTDES